MNTSELRMSQETDSFERDRDIDNFKLVARGEAIGKRYYNPVSGDFLCFGFFKLEEHPEDTELAINNARKVIEAGLGYEVASVTMDQEEARALIDSMAFVGELE